MPGGVHTIHQRANNREPLPADEQVVCFTDYILVQTMWLIPAERLSRVRPCDSGRLCIVHAAECCSVELCFASTMALPAQPTGTRLALPSKT